MMKMVEIMMMMRRKRMITKYQDYNWYNSSVITERKDNHIQIQSRQTANYLSC